MLSRSLTAGRIKIGCLVKADIRVHNAAVYPQGQKWVPGLPCTMLISTYSSKLRGKAGKSHVMGGSEFSLNSVIIQDIHFRDQCIRVQTGGHIRHEH